MPPWEVFRCLCMKAKWMDSGKLSSSRSFSRCDYWACYTWAEFPWDCCHWSRVIELINEKCCYLNNECRLKKSLTVFVWKQCGWILASSIVFSFKVVTINTYYLSSLIVGNIIYQGEWRLPQQWMPFQEVYRCTVNGYWQVLFEGRDYLNLLLESRSLVTIRLLRSSQLSKRFLPFLLGNRG